MARLLAIAVLVVAAAGCRVDVELGVDVAQDGSGTIEVAVGLDPDAAGRVPRLVDQLEVGDLREAGWVITGPAVADDGWTWIRASKPFASPEQAGAVLAEITGADGPVRDFSIEREASAFFERWRLEGRVDLRAGLDAFSDDALRARLDGTSFGVDLAELERRAGVPLEEAVQFRVAARLPGTLTSNASVDVAGAAVWRPVLGDDLRIDATGRIADTGRLALAGLAVLSGVTGGLVLLAQGVRRRRRPGRPRGVVDQRAR